MNHLFETLILIPADIIRPSGLNRCQLLQLWLSVSIGVLGDVPMHQEYLGGASYW